MTKDLSNLITVINSYGYNIEEGKAICCPIHNEDTASFHITTGADGEAYWKCFGCDRGGDMYNFVMEMDNVGFAEAKAKVCGILGIPNNDIPSKLTKFKEAFAKVRPAKADDTYQYDRMHLYMNANNDPVIGKAIWKNNAGKKEAVTYKIVDQGDYYQYGTKKKLGDYEYVVYNYPRVKEAISKGYPVYFVEGEKDADNLIKLGKCATTIISKNNNEDVWTKYQEQLRGAKIVFIGDTGIAGNKFKKNCWDNLRTVVTSFKVVTLPGLEELGDNKDVTDWLETGYTKDELEEAVSDAWDWKVSDKWKDITITEKKDGSVVITPKKTIDNFKIVLDNTNTKVFINEITKVIEVETNFFKNKTLDTLKIEIASYCIKVGFKVTKVDVGDWIETIAHEKSVNPFKKYLDNLEAWDGTTRLDDYFDLFTIKDGFDNDLKRLLMKKWLLSIVATVYDPKFKAYGLLVLKGSQGIGKGECFKRLVPVDANWTFTEEGKFEGSRDNTQVLTSSLITELSEFARSAKAIDELKGFVTASEDKLMLKWEKYPITFKRKTVLFATINDGEFLLDDENRRFWVIDLESIDWDGINKFEYNQLWAELKEAYLANPVVDMQPCYHLTPAERELLQESNRQFNYEGEVATELRKLFDFDSPVRIWLTGDEIARLGDMKRSSTTITRELKKMGEQTSERKRFNGKRARYNTCPLPRYWHGQVELKWKDRLVNKLELVADNIVKDTPTTDNADKIAKLELIIKDLQLNLKKLAEENEALRDEVRFWEQYNEAMENK